MVATAPSLARTQVSTFAWIHVSVVTDVDYANPDACGGFADIHKGMYQGSVVALKRFRGIHRNDQNTVNVSSIIVYPH